MTTPPPAATGTPLQGSWWPSGRHRRAATGGALAAAATYSWVAAGFDSFTAPAAVLTALPILSVAAVAFARPFARTRRRPELVADGTAPPGSGPPATGWALLLVLAAVWEARQYVAEPRYDHPTISSIIDGAFRRSAAAEALLFLVWLGTGLYLARSVLVRRSLLTRRP